MYAMRLNGQSRHSDIIDDINQSIDVILTTPKGSRIADHKFGCALWDFLDQPMTAMPRLIAEVTAAINQYETRITLTSIEPDISQAANGRLHIKLNYILNGQQYDYQLTVNR
ncbi:hypothetical protein HG263_05440 [Pseudoalteromonas sp. JBTF-M23]|uniref:IraD/Gp25-like domain-containing protein n=1 Tax=Pseudoalteromonas caenipelagi TaxID=2726988 RepID=A0A849V8T5_9GAMM|nr:GPW/gp25 family protein [Pseudoalteromonas caenipelagi]NOU49979.1 hypothetical protein [Pseudoalteromonas caenipelagi]